MCMCTYLCTYVTWITSINVFFTTAQSKNFQDTKGGRGLKYKYLQEVRGKYTLKCASASVALLFVHCPFIKSITSIAIKTWNNPNNPTRGDRIYQLK